MILKSLIGIGAMDHRRNALVHELSNKETAVYAAHQLLTKRSIQVAEAVVNEPANRQKIARCVDGMLDVLVEVVRVERISDSIRTTAESAIATLEAAREGSKCDD
jgi:FixJ family two-component response regulator